MKGQTENIIMVESGIIFLVYSYDIIICQTKIIKLCELCKITMETRGRLA